MGSDYLSTLYVMIKALHPHLTILISIISIHYIIRKCLSLSHKALRKQLFGEYLGLSAIPRFYRPLSYLVWIYGFVYWMQIGAKKSSSNDIFFSTFLSIASLICFSWILLMWKKELSKELYKLHVDDSHPRLTKTNINIIMKVLSFMIIFVIVFSLMRVFGFDLQALLTIGGVGALAVGLAAKEVLANFFGGVMIYFTQPFEIGDIVLLDGGEIEGVIEEVGWYYTKIYNFEKCPIYLPNALFSSKVIINRTRRTHRRFKETIGIRYKDFSRIPGLLEEIRRYISSYAQVDQEQPKYVHFTSFGDSSLDLYIAVYIKTKFLKEFLQVKEEILLQVGHIIHARKAAVAYPTRTIEMVQKA